jgi:hypothetical protein
MATGPGLAKTQPSLPSSLREKRRRETAQWFADFWRSVGKGTVRDLARALDLRSCAVAQALMVGDQKVGLDDFVDLDDEDFFALIHAFKAFRTQRKARLAEAAAQQRQLLRSHG